LIYLCFISTNFAFRFRASFKVNNRCKSSPLCMASGGIAEKLGSIVELISGQSKITESNIEDSLKEIKTVLLDADVNLQVTNALIAQVKSKAIGMKVGSGQKPGEQFISLLAAELVELMGKAQTPLTRRTDGRPNVILLSGLQGAGKTTAAAKLASWALKQSYSKKVLLVAADVYRPAAIEQLMILGNRVGVDVYTEGQDISPVLICRRALAKAIAEGYDTVIVDTAGRQVIDDKLMDELKQIKAAVLPDEVLLVVDAMTGQEAAMLTARFDKDVSITGAILTKMDGDTRGGAALSVRAVSGKPIKFVGVGEGLDDLEPFYPDRMASRILGMGDVQTLIEKAQSAIDFDKSAQIGRKMQKGDFDFDDFLLQSQSLKKLGGMGSMLRMMPGMAGKISDEQLFEAEKRIKKCETIISAMSAEERTQPDLLIRLGGQKELVRDAQNRRIELSKRCGYSVTEVDSFLIEFASMRKMMRQNMKGINMDDLDSDPTKPVQTEAARLAQQKKEKKLKPTRGGGGGFGAR